MDRMRILDRYAYALRCARLDWSFNPLRAFVAGLALWLLSIAVTPVDARRSFLTLCRAHRELMQGGTPRLLASWLNRTIERSIRHACVPPPHVDLFLPRAPRPQLSQKLAAASGIVLKNPIIDDGRVVERGVLLLKNNERIDLVRRSVDMATLLDRYALVLEPSWTAYADPRLLAFARYPEHPVLVMTTCEADEVFLRRLRSNLRPIAIGSNDWANPEVFVPLDGTEKSFDAVMIARWRIWKRHHVLFRALRQIGDRNYRVALAAAPVLGRSDRAAIMDMIARSGLAEQVTVFEHLSHAELNVLLNRSKVNVLLSRQEGGNRGLSEGFFAGVPGLALKGHLGVQTSYFTKDTGRMIDESDLAGALLEFRERWRDFNPRPWALANISPDVSTRRLNDALRQLAIDRHEPWTRDIVAKCNAQELEYYPVSAGVGMKTMEDVIALEDRGATR